MQTTVRKKASVLNPTSHDHKNDPPSLDEIKATLELMLKSEPLRDSPQLASFLSFIVQETLAGRGPDLKGYSIATLALGRPDSFDPQTDPIVRVQAGRLRQAIAEYHAANPGAVSVIHLDKGVYIPRFERREVGSVVPSKAPRASSEPPILLPPTAAPLTETSAAESVRTVAPPTKVAIKKWPLVAVTCAIALIFAGIALYQYLRGDTQDAQRKEPVIVERFVPSMIVEADADTSDNPELRSILQRTRDAIARFDDIIVVHDVTDMVSTVSRVGKTKPGSALVLRIASLPASEGTQRFSARLIDLADQALLWSREFTPVAVGAYGDASRTRIVQSISTTIAQPYGVIYAYVQNKIKSGARSDDPFGCIVASFDYWRVNDRKTHKIARDCLIETLTRHPFLAGVHAQLTSLYLEEFRQGYNPLPGNPLDRALESAKRAVAVAPASARSYQALLAAHFARREMDEAWRAASQALDLNPYDTEIIADVGARYVQTGSYERGLSMLNDALQLNPAPPTWAVTFRALGLYMLGRLDKSGPTGSALRGTEAPLAMMGLVLVARQYLDERLGKEALSNFQRVHPSIVNDPEAFLRRLNMDEQTIGRIVSDFNTSRNWVTALP